MTQAVSLAAFLDIAPNSFAGQGLRRTRKLKLIGYTHLPDAYDAISTILRLTGNLTALHISPIIADPALILLIWKQSHTTLRDLRLCIYLDRDICLSVLESFHVLSRMQLMVDGIFNFCGPLRPLGIGVNSNLHTLTHFHFDIGHSQDIDRMDRVMLALSGTRLPALQQVTFVVLVWHRNKWADNILTFITAHRPHLVSATFNLNNRLLPLVIRHLDICEVIISSCYRSSILGSSIPLNVTRLSLGKCAGPEWSMGELYATTMATLAGVLYRARETIARGDTLQLKVLKLDTFQWPVGRVVRDVRRELHIMLIRQYALASLPFNIRIVDKDGVDVNGEQAWVHHFSYCVVYAPLTPTSDTLNGIGKTLTMRPHHKALILAGIHSSSAILLHFSFYCS
jgi:hypothetical protein